MPKFYADVDLRKNQLVQARLENVQQPAEIQPGRVWFDPIAGKLKFGNAAGDAAIDPTDREQHHGAQDASTIRDLAPVVQAYSLSTFAVPTADLPFANKKLIDVADGSAPTHGATVGQVTALVDATEADIRADLAAQGTTNASDLAALAARTLDLVPAPAAHVSLNQNKLINVGDGTDITDGATVGQVNAVAYQVSTLGALTLDQVPQAAGWVNLNTQQIFNLAEGTQPTSATTLAQVTTLVATTEQSIRDDVAASDAASAAELAALTARTLDLVPAPAADVSLASHKIVALANGTAPTDAATVGQVTTLVATTEQDIRDDIATQVAADAAALAAVAARTLDLVPAPAGNVTMSGFRLTNLGNSVGAADAVTRAELDAIRNGTDWKQSVLVKASANHSLSGLAPIGGVTPEEGSRVLLVAQDNAAENGPWLASAGAWSRPPDADTGTLTAGAALSIERGAGGGTSWRLVETTPITVGTDPQTWVQFAAATAYTGSGGVVLTDTDFSLAANVPRKHVQAVGGAAQVVVSHNLGTRDITVSVYFEADGTEVECDIARTSANAITLGFADPYPAADSLRCVVIG